MLNFHEWSAVKRERWLRRLDAACVVFLLFTFISHMLRGSNPEVDGRTADPQHLKPVFHRRCPSIEFKDSSRGSALYESPDYQDLLEVVQAKFPQDADDQARKEPELPPCDHDFQALDTEVELNCNCKPILPETLREMWPTMRAGRWKPDDCRPIAKLAIIIPYINRYTHVHILLDVLIPFLRRQKIDFTFFVIEQASPSMFNRATLHNIGFIESLKLGNFDCFIFHDVDLVPMDDRIEYRCGRNPRHFSVAIKRYGARGPRKMYDENFGGIVGFSRSQYLAVNGNSNLYFGWGGEDDDLRKRMVTRGFEHEQEDPQIYRYQMLKHDRNDRSKGNVDRMLMLRTAADRMVVEGLNSLKYRVNYIKFDKLYTWINVSFNMTELLLTAPDYTMFAIRSVLELSKTVS